MGEKSNELTVGDVNDKHNGLCPLPPEILAHILSFVDPDTLVFQCRLVCKNWRNIIDDQVWKILIRSTKVESLSKLTNAERKEWTLPWYISYSIFTKDPFERNIIEFAEVLWSEFEQRKPCMQPPPVYLEKRRRMTFKKCGLYNKIMDEWQPTITVTLWSAKKMHYKNVYDSNVVELLKKIGYARRIDEKCAVDIKILESSEKEEKVEMLFENYGPHKRFLEILEFESHYIFDFKRISVKVSLPSVPSKVIISPVTDSESDLDTVNTESDSAPNSEPNSQSDYLTQNSESDYLTQNSESDYSKPDAVVDNSDSDSGLTKPTDPESD